MLILLFKLRTKILINSIIRAELSRKILWVLAVLFGFFFAFISFATGMSMFNFLYKTNGADGLLAILNVLFLGFLPFILFSATAVAFYALFTSPDLPIWLTAPVPLRVIFLEKFGEVLAGSSGFYVFMFLPALVALGFVLDASYPYFLILVPVSVLFIAIPTGIGMTLTLFIVRFIRFERAKEILGAIGGILGLGIYLGTQLLTSGSGQNLRNARAVFKTLQNIHLPFFPTAWASEVLVGTGTANYHSIVLPSILLVGLSTGVFALALAVNGRIYYNGLNRISDLNTIKRKGRITGKTVILPFLSGPVGAIVIKDLKYLSRDIQEWVQFLWPLAFIFVFIFKTNNDLLRAINPFGLNGTEAFFNAAFLLFIMSMFAVRLSITGLGRERRSVWIIHQAPVKRSKIILAKLLVAYFPSLIMAELIYIIIGFIKRSPLGATILGTFILAGVLLGVNAMGILVGSIYPRFDAANPKQLVQGMGGFVYLLLSSLYIAISLGLFMLPQFGRLVHINPLLLWILSVVVLYAAVAVSTFIFVTIAAKRLERIEVIV